MNLNGKMKAAVITGPMKMAIQEVPIPEIGDEDVLIEILACGICTTDIELYDGTMPYLTSGLTPLPLIPGHEWSGKVAKVGKNVTGLKIGQLVTGDVSIGCSNCHNCMQGKYHLCTDRKEIGIIRYDGAFAEYVKVPVRNVYKLPDGFSALTAMFLEPAATSVNGVIRTGIKFGDRVVVFGDGAIGLFAAQAALAQGASRVAVVARKNLNQGLIKSWGLDFINTTKIDVESAIENLWETQADVVFEATGNPDVINDAIRVTTSGGKICALSIVGKPRVAIDIDSIVCRDISIIGVVASPNAFLPTIRMMTEGKLHVDGMVTAKYLLADCNEAFDFVKHKKGPRIKVAIVKDMDVS